MSHAEGDQAAQRILVVDDDDPLLRIHVRALENHRYSVTAAGNGEEAVKALADRSFDVILSDIDMPGMNGIQLLKHVRARDLDVPVVLLTGTPSVETAMA